MGAEPLPPPNPNRGERPDPKTRDHSSALPSDLWVSRTGVASPKTSQAAQGRLALVASLPTSCPSFPADRQTSLAALSPAARDFLPLQSRHTARVPPQPEEEEGPRGSAGAPPPAALGAGSQSIPHAHGAHCSIRAQGLGKKNNTRKSTAAAVPNRRAASRPRPQAEELCKQPKQAIPQIATFSLSL